MSDISSNNKRIAKNTVMLYIRMLLVMGVSLYTSRVILSTIGIEDYGIYNVVGGFVSMFSIITSSITVSISRFITIELGKGDLEKLRMVFQTSLRIQLIISFIIIILTEAVGIWFLYNKMQIPEGRHDAAQWVLHCSILTFAISLLTVPYRSSIVAHEKMSVYAYISILEVFLKLGIVYLLYISSHDRLVLYAILMLIVSIVLALIYVVYCRHNFKECSGKSHTDSTTFRNMWGFAGWSFLGNSAYILNTQGVNMIMNIFFGVIVNAARGIANQVDSAVSQFSSNFTVAINPQIMKSYAIGNKQEAFLLTCRGAKFSFMLMYLIALPIILEADQILHLWLGTPPDNSAKFVIWTVLASLINTIGHPLLTLVNASGDIKKYQIYITLFGFAPFPLTWIAFKLGATVIWAYIIYFCIYYVLAYVRLWLVHNKTGIPYSLFLREAILRTHIVALISLILPFLVIRFCEPSIIRLSITTIVSVLSCAITMFIIGLTTNERKAILTKIENIIHKLK